MEQGCILKNGEVFGRYTVERILGRGGMGAVYLVRHRVTDAFYALKVLDSKVAEKNGDFVTRFIREAKLASNLRHPNLAVVNDAGLDESRGLYYLVMEYLPGGNLRDRIAESGRLAPHEAIHIARQIAAALVTANKNGMVHRDIKPDNIMFAADGSAKLADWGIAKGNGEQDTLVTMASAVFGTPAYMAPEQATDASSVDCRADIWSLGIVLYEMLSGRRPYEGSGLGAIVAQLLSPDPFPDIRMVAPDVPEALASLIGEMCKKNRDERVATPRELVAKLGALAQQFPQNGNSPVSNALVTLPTQATISTVGGIVPYVEPMTDPEVKRFEMEVVAKNARCRNRRRLMRILICVIAVFVGLVMFWLLSDGGDKDARVMQGNNMPTKVQQSAGSPIVEPQTNVAAKITVARPQTDVVLANASNAVEKSRMEATPVPTKTNEYSVVVVTNSIVEPQRPSSGAFLLGVGNEEPVLQAYVGGHGSFCRISGKPESVYAQVDDALARHPSRVVISLSGYAAGREMSQERFSLFLRDVGGRLNASGIPFAFVAGGGDYGRITRALAQVQSWDIVD